VQQDEGKSMNITIFIEIFMLLAGSAAFVISGGAVGGKIGSRSRMLRVLAAIVAIVGGIVLLNDLYNDTDLYDWLVGLFLGGESPFVYDPSGE
jgi:hypothetical protein